VRRLTSWLHGFREDRFVTEKTQEVQFAFFDLALALICLRFWERSFVSSFKAVLVPEGRAFERGFYKPLNIKSLRLSAIPWNMPARERRVKS
jgi:hypothetical protein